MDPQIAPVFISCRDPLLQNYLKAFLAHFGHPIYCCEKEDEIQARVKQIAPALVVLDFIPPETAYLELETTIQELKPPPAFLFLTNPKDMESKQMFEEGEGLDYLQRPLDPVELKEKVQRLLARVKGLPETDKALEPWRGNLVQAEQPHSWSIWGVSKEIKALLEIADRVAETDATVLIRGESGTGKELLARRIHARSARRDKPFIKVLCPAIPETLLESELFGYEKGSFTGAFRRKPGRFEFANQGTIFLDEIGDIPLSLQSKLLQVLQEGEFARLGGNADIRVNVRIISATNRDLEKAVREGMFREDLFYRLNVVNIYMLPLRDRREDIPIFVHTFLECFNHQFNKRAKLSNDTLKLFMKYRWPGNVRELENTLEGMVILGNEKDVVSQLRSKMKQQSSPGTINGQGKSADASDPIALSSYPDRRKVQLRRNQHNRREHSTLIPFNDRRTQYRRQNVTMTPSADASAVASHSLKAVSREASRKAEQELIRKVLDQTHWNRKKAAEILGISYKAILYKMKPLPTKTASSDGGTPLAPSPLSSPPAGEGEGAA